GRMLLVACRHVRWTHGRSSELAALAIAIAHVDGGGKAAVAAEVEMRLDVDRMIGRTMAEILTWRGAVYDLPRIHTVVGVKGVFHLLERFVQYGTKMLLVEPAAGQAIAVLTAHAAAVFNDQIANFLHHRDHFVDFGGLFEIDPRPDMQAAHAGVAVITSSGVVGVDNLTETAQEIRQFGRVDGGIFDERNRFVVIAPAHEQTESGLAHFPDIPLRRWRQRLCI